MNGGRTETCESEAVIFTACLQITKSFELQILEPAIDHDCQFDVFTLLMQKISLSHSSVASFLSVTLFNLSVHRFSFLTLL